MDNRHHDPGVVTIDARELDHVAGGGVMPPSAKPIVFTLLAAGGLAIAEGIDWARGTGRYTKDNPTQERPLH